MAENSVSYNFALVPDGHHRGAGEMANKTVPDGSGNITFTTSLAFLYDKAEKMKKAKKKSMLLGVLNANAGFDGVKKRLNSYGLFGKKTQNNSKKFDADEMRHIFLWGQNINGYESSKIYNAMAAVERFLGDEKATFRNIKTSPKYQEALKFAETANLLVVAHYDESFFNEDEENPENYTLSLGYVKFSTKMPIISSFEHPTKDGLKEIEWNGEKASDYKMDNEGSISLITTRSYLKNYNGSEYQNLKNLTNKSDETQKFWLANLTSYTKEEFPAELAASFSDETLEELKTSDRIVFSYIFGKYDTKTIDEILKADDQNAKIVFTGLIEDDASNDKRISFYETEPDDQGKTSKIATIRLRQGTFFTQKLI